jgi:hypothetical protein
MKRWLCLGIVSLLAGAAPAQSRDVLRQGGTLSRTEPVAAQSSKRANVFEKRLPEVSLEDSPFESVMEWLGEVTGMNISVRWQALRDAGVERDRPISIRAKNLRVSQVLWIIMNQAGGPDIRLAYRTSGNLLTLSTEQDLNQEMILKVYDVSDLLARIPRFTNPPTLNLQQALHGVASGTAVDTFDDPADEPAGPDDEAGVSRELAWLIQQITHTVEPDSWASAGGRGTIGAFNRMLIVRNTILVHQQLGGAVLED